MRETFPAQFGAMTEHAAEARMDRVSAGQACVVAGAMDHGGSICHNPASNEAARMSRPGERR